MIFVIFSILLAPLLKRSPPATPTRIVIVQVAKIGDFVCTTPLIRNLKRAYPKARIVLIATPSVAGLAAQLPFIDAMIDSPVGSTRGLGGKIKWIRRLRQGRFDIAFCCNGGVAWPGILALAGIPTRVGLTPNFRGKSTALAQHLWTAKTEHRGNQLIGTSYAIMASHVGVKNWDPQKDIRSPRSALAKVHRFLDGEKVSEEHFRIGIAVSSANKLKELGAPLLAAICQGVLDKMPGATLVLLGTASDRGEAEQIAGRLHAAQGQHIVDSCGLFALSEIPCLISELDIFVGVDSGLTYIADALNIPLVSIAGPCNMQETRPTNASAKIIQHNLPCTPCAHIFHAPYTCHLGTRACIQKIAADEVVTEVLKLCVSTHK